MLAYPWHFIFKKLQTIGFDLNKDRINELKNGYDSFNDQKKRTY